MKWKISEVTELTPTQSELFVFTSATKSECVSKKTLRTLTDDGEDLQFSLVFNNASKKVGYHFAYKNPPKDGVVMNDKTVLWYYTEESLKDRKFDIIYEDQIIRLLSFQSGNSKDYWLVGRWRQ